MKNKFKFKDDAERHGVLMLWAGGFIIGALCGIMVGLNSLG